MTVLAVLTVVYAFVLVLALAASLIAILIYLRRIRSALAETATALERVSDQTAPLGEPLHLLDRTVGDVAEQLQGAEETMSQAAEHMGRVSDRTTAVGTK